MNNPNRSAKEKGPARLPASRPQAAAMPAFQVLVGAICSSFFSPTLSDWSTILLCNHGILTDAIVPCSSIHPLSITNLRIIQWWSSKQASASGQPIPAWILAKHDEHVSGLHIVHGFVWLGVWFPLTNISYLEGGVNSPVQVASHIPVRNPPKHDEQVSAGLHCIHAFAGMGLRYPLIDYLQLHSQIILLY